MGIQRGGDDRGLHRRGKLIPGQPFRPPGRAGGHRHKRILVRPQGELRGADLDDAPVQPQPCRSPATARDTRLSIRDGLAQRGMQLSHEGDAQAVRGRGHIVRGKRSRLTVPARL